MSELPYEYIVRSAPYSDGSGYAAKAEIEPGDDGQPSVKVDIVYRLSRAEWDKLKVAIDNAFDLAAKTDNAQR